MRAGNQRTGEEDTGRMEGCGDGAPGLWEGG